MKMEHVDLLIVGAGTSHRRQEVLTKTVQIIKGTHAADPAHISEQAGMA